MSKSVPHRCEQCSATPGLYTGALVFEGQKPPKCKTHRAELTPVPKPKQD